MKSLAPIPLCCMVIALLAGCSVAGSPTAATVSVPSVDVSALDTGTYPTSPRPPFGKATEDDIIAVEGQRLAQFVLAPFEVDRDLTAVQSPTGIIKGTAGVSMVINQKSSTVAANKQLIYGFTSSAKTSDTLIRQRANRSLRHMVLRYATADAARDAARQMADLVAAGDKQQGGGRRAPPDLGSVRDPDKGRPERELVQVLEVRRP